jgi:Tol biopolymer transport system component
MPIFPPDHPLHPAGPRRPAGGRPPRCAAPPRRPRAAVALAAVLVALAGCSAGSPGAAPSSPGVPPSLPAPSPAPTPSAPIPAPTGTALTAAVAAAPHFLLSLAGNLSDFSVTAVEGQNLDNQDQPTAVLGGAPVTAGDALYSPSLSPDRSKVVYVEAPVAALASPANDGGGTLVVEDVDGTHARAVASGDNVSPVWSPDGRQIAFVRAGALWVMNADGSGAHALGINLSVNYYLSWSPDGTQLAVAAGQPSRVYAVTLATGAAVPVGSAAQESTPAWSPDGKQLVFTEGATSSLYVADVASGAVTRLTTCTNPCAEDTQPAWSPDGALIAFVRFTGGGAQPGTEQIYVVPAAGGTPQEVTAGPVEHAFPNW